MCLGAGARLCTADEIQNGETSLTGCGFDTRHVWTKSQGDCGAGEVLTVMGSPEFQDDDPPRCTSMIDPRINLALGKPARADSELVRDGRLGHACRPANEKAARRPGARGQQPVPMRNLWRGSGSRRRVHE